MFELRALQSWARRRRSDTSVNLFTVSLLSNWLRLSVIKALNILKLFNPRSQDLQSRRGFDSSCRKDNSKILHTHNLGCLGGGVQLFFCLHEQIFTICNVPNWTSPQPTATWISTITWWIRFPRRWQNFTSVPGLFWWQHVPLSRRLSIDKIPTRAPLPSTI